MKQKIWMLLALTALAWALALSGAQASMPRYASGEAIACDKCKDVDSGYRITGHYVADGVSWHKFQCLSCMEEFDQRCGGGRATCLYGAVCAVCKNAYTDPDPSAHSFGRYESDSNATCTQDGTKTAYCERCGTPDTQPDAGSALGHSFTKYESNRDATCTQDGTKTAKCDRCDAVDTQPDVGSALGHSFTKYASNNDATCTQDGTKTAKCDRCDAVDTQQDIGSALGHDFKQDWWVLPTCTEDGQESDRCTRCGQYDAAVVPMVVKGSALGHSFTQYVSNNDAACTQDGTKTAKCDRCEAVDTQPDAGSALGHSFTQYVSNNDAGCVKDGTKTAKCDRCDATDTQPDAGSALGHSFTKYASNNDATCTQDGTKTAKCDRCDATDTQPDAGTALGHDMQPTVVKPTCSQKGYTLYTCTRCGESYTADETDAKGHWFGEWTPLTGEKHSAVCQRAGCGYVGTADCQMIETRVSTVDGEQVISFCAVCGQVKEGERFTLVSGAKATTSLSTRGSAVIRLQEGDAPLLIVAYAQGGRMTLPKGDVRVVVPASLVEGRTLTLLEQDGAETALPCEISGSSAVFHLTFTATAPRVVRLDAVEE